MGATMTSLVAKVTELTRRPDIQDTIKLAIRTATLRAHRKALFPLDRRAYAFTYTPPSNGAIFVDVTAALLTVCPQFRSASHVIGTDSIGNPSESLEEVPVVSLFKSDGTPRQSVFTLLGQTLTIYPALFTGYGKLHYYMNPIVTDVGYASWIADMYEDDLALWATAIVWMRTGRVDEARVLMSGVITDFVNLLLESHATTGVR